MSEPSNTPKECLSCHAQVTGEFCQNCGQSAGVHRITFRETINEFFSSTFALEGPLLSTIRLLIVNPGKLFREFIGGKRKPYYKPVAFFVVMTAVYLIIRAIIGYNPLEGEMTTIDENSPTAIQNSKRAAFFMVANINNIMLFLVFAIGLNFKLFFRKQCNLAEYVTMGFYIAGIYTIVGLIQMLVVVYLFPISKQLILLFLIFYIFYTAISFFQRKSIWAMCKYFLVGIFSLILYIIFGYGFSYLVVSLF